MISVVHKYDNTGTSLAPMLIALETVLAPHAPVERCDIFNNVAKDTQVYRAGIL